MAFLLIGCEHAQHSGQNVQGCRCGLALFAHNQTRTNRGRHRTPKAHCETITYDRPQSILLFWGDELAASATGTDGKGHSRPRRRPRALIRAVLPGPVYRRYRRRKLSWAIARYRSREVTHVYGGHELTIELSDPMAEGWYDRDGPSPVGTALLREREVLKPGARVFNFGAHQGLVALIFAREVGPSGQVVAIEAVRHNARAAETNRVLNAASNMHVLHAAGAAAEGMIPFTESFNGRADEHGLTSIQARSVDGLARAYGDPDVVFVDVEGYEEQVLRGAAATLANRRTAFVVEVHKPETLARYGATVEDVFGYFTKGFDVFVTLGDQMPLAPAHALEGRGFLVALPAASDLAG